VARHRRPVRAATPLELLMFDPAEWADPADGLEDWRAVERWKDARRAYSKTHPDSELGSVLDQMRYERWVRGRRAGWKMPDLYPWGA
jgi:hypothetical protein